MQNQQLEIPIESIKTDFDYFLSLDSNKRLIFSGPFGIGKTYFLDKFFGSKNEKYYPVFLRPVNYSLLSNEDIFKLIKYDIIFQILKDIDVSSEFEFSKLEYSSNFLNFNKYLILKNLLRHIPVIKQGIELGQDIEKLVEAYQKGWSQINNSENKNFLNDFYEANENHFLLEFDHVSKFISDQLDDISIKKGGSEKPLKKVLIIDDLDRLDPEHIFRLFNVFSAHFDDVKYYEDGEDIKDNKFGFDKIIFVCDIENIRNIFSHKYGAGVDFSGYVDKFYSRQIYYLLHRNAFQKYIQPYVDGQFQQLPILDNLKYKKVFFYMLQVLFDGKQLNIRDIIRLGDIHLSDLIAKDNKFRNIEVQLDKIGAPIHSFIEHYPICISVYILSKLFVNGSTFLEKFNKAFFTSSSVTSDYEYETFEFMKLMPQLILFADYENHRFKVDIGKESKQENQDIYKFVEYPNLTYKLYGNYINQYHSDEGPMYFNVSIIDNNMKISKAVFLKTLVSASKTIIDLGIING